jgi:hypothetical protein
MSRSCLEDWPALTFRPAEDPRSLQGVLRYDLDRRLFVPDDGGEALSWVGLLDAYPFFWFIQIPTHDNVVGRFVDQDGVLHRMLRNPVKPRDLLVDRASGEPYPDYYNHPSVIAAEEARRYCGSLYGYANGKEIPITIRTNTEGCAWCADDALGHRLMKASGLLADARQSLERIHHEIRTLEEQARGLQDSLRERQENVRILSDQMERLGVDQGAITAAKPCI